MNLSYKGNKRSCGIEYRLRHTWKAHADLNCETIGWVPAGKV